MGNLLLPSIIAKSLDPELHSQLLCSILKGQHILKKNLFIPLAYNIEKVHLILAIFDSMLLRHLYQFPYLSPSN